jgi:hypothetical protein
MQGSRQQPSAMQIALRLVSTRLKSWLVITSALNCLSLYLVSSPTPPLSKVSSIISMMSPVLQFLQVATSLFTISNALPNLPQITSSPFIGKLEVKRDTSTNQDSTLVGYYTTSSGAPWEINTCGESASWSTSGEYGACAGKASQSLYTSCSDNVLVADAGLTTQSWYIPTFVKTIIWITC